MQVRRRHQVSGRAIPEIWYVITVKVTAVASAAWLRSFQWCWWQAAPFQILLSDWFAQRRLAERQLARQELSQSPPYVRFLEDCSHRGRNGTGTGFELCAGESYLHCCCAKYAQISPVKLSTIKMFKHCTMVSTVKWLCLRSKWLLSFAMAIIACEACAFPVSAPETPLELMLPNGKKSRPAFQMYQQGVSC